jgi:hypothetical protein
MLLTTSAGARGQAGTLLPEDVVTGDWITVTTAGGKQFRGRLLADARDELVLLANRRRETFVHTEIDRVTRRHNRFLFGPLIGFGAGLAVGLPAERRFRNEGVTNSSLVWWSAGIGVVIGTFVDLVNGSDRAIYVRRRP